MFTEKNGVGMWWTRTLDQFAESCNVVRIHQCRGVICETCWGECDAKVGSGDLVEAVVIWLMGRSSRDDGIDEGGGGELKSIVELEMRRLGEVCGIVHCRAWCFWHST